MNDSRFQCADCRVWLEQDSAQVVLGVQSTGRVGRCAHCGKGLPAITFQSPYPFIKDNRPYRIVLAWEAMRQVYVYAVLKGPSWKPVDCFDLSQLREVVGSITGDTGISETEVEVLRRELYESSDADLWAKLVRT